MQNSNEDVAVYSLLTAYVYYSYGTMGVYERQVPRQSERQHEVASGIVTEDEFSNSKKPCGLLQWGLCSDVRKQLERL